MKTLRMLAVIAATSVAAVGCDSDLLTTVPSDRISDELFWKTEQDFTFAINAAYRELLRIDWGNGRILGGTYYDNASDLGYSQQYWASMSDVARGLTDALSGPHGGVWSVAYEGLAKVNEVLAQLETVEEGVLSAESRALIEGQAHFLRGYHYHRLLWHFGGVPLVTRILSPEEAREVSRASRSEIYQFIIAELDAAASMLPDSWSAADRGRATRGAALAYKARAALYEASYTKYGAGDPSGAQSLFQTAADAAEDVMESGMYALHPNYADLFTYAGESSSEVIFDWQVNVGQNGAMYWFDYAPASQAGREVALSATRALVDKFYMTDGLLPEDSPLYDDTPPQITYDGSGGATVVTLGQYADRDPRFYATVLFPGAENFDGTIFNSYPPCSGVGVPGYCSNTAEAWDPGNFYNTPTGYLIKKYLDPVDRANREESGINFIMMRYADVLLMYAEAQIELGNLGPAAGAMDEVRGRVGMPGVSLGSQEEAIDLIRNERAVELAFEGLRYADLRRWRMAETVMPGFARGIDYDLDGDGTWEPLRVDIERVFRAPRDYLWPIPATERELNPNLEQNPGY